VSDDELDSLLREVGRAPPRPVDARYVDDGRYELGALLGEGSFGVVYEAFDRARGARVALKLLRRASPEALLRFKREFRELSRLADPSFVRLYDLHGDGDRWYFTMERLEATRFDAWCTDMTRLRGALEGLSEALRRLHRAGFVHRDIKPSNVLVRRDGSVVLLDFGLVYAAHDPRSTVVAGTPAYVAPEVLAGGAPTARSDWYAVGVMLYEALTGEPPFSGAAEEILRDKQTRAAPPVLERAPSAPADLARLCDALLDRDPNERPDGLRGREEPGGSRVFVGRRPELDALEAALASPPSVVHLVGPSGIGKSSLLRELVTAARRRGACVLTSRCHVRDHVPFMGLDGLVDDLARTLTGAAPARVRALAPRHAAELSLAFPVLRALPGFERAAVGEGARSRITGALREVLVRWSAGAPLLLVVDDAQWIDDDSVAVLAELACDPEAPLCLVLASRPGWALPPLRGAPTALPLGPLAPGDARTLAAQSGAGLALEAVLEEAAGHPLFLIELARARGAGDTRASLRDIVGARFEGLSEDAGRGARLLAVSGAPVPLEVLRAAGVAEAALDELVAARFATPHDDDSVRVYHDRVRELVAERLTAEEARRLHLQLARAFLERLPDRFEALALHFEEAGALQEAAEQILKGARAATRARAFAQARALYGRFFAVMDRVTPRADVPLAVRVERAEASARAGMAVESAEAYLSASRWAEPRRAIELRLRAAEQLLTAGHLARGQRILDEELHHLGVTVASTTAGHLLRTARERAGMTLDRLVTSPASEERLQALWTACRGALSVHPVRAVALGASLVREAARPGAGVEGRLAAAFMEGLGAVGKLGPEGVPRASARLALERADLSIPTLAQAHALYEGSLCYFGLELTRSAAHLDRAVDLGVTHGLGHTFEETLARSLRSSLAWIAGDVSYLRANAPTLRAELDERDHLMGWVLVAMHVLWLTIVEQGDSSDARAQLAEVERRWASRDLDLQGWWRTIALVHFALVGGDGRAAWRLAGPSSRPYKERVFASLMHKLEADVFFARAGIAIAARDRASMREVEGQVRAIVRRLARVPSSWARAHASCLEAGLESVRGDREATFAALRAARSDLADAGMPLLGALVEDASGVLEAGDAGRERSRAARDKLRAWRVDRHVAMACTLPGAW